MKGLGKMHNSLNALYPDNKQEFNAMFPDEKSCIYYLKRLRWPKGFVCPNCKLSSEMSWESSRERSVCPKCGYQATATANTIFDKTRTPLKLWFEAAWQITTAKNGVSAKTLERTIGISYRTAWMMLHRFRVAMVVAERTQLSGNVEIDETFVGGEEHGGKRGRGTEKSIVAIAVEIIEPTGFGRIRMRTIPDASSDSLLPFIKDAIAPHTRITTDGWSGYSGLEDMPYEWNRIVLSSADDLAHIVMPGVHRVASLMKRWILGTHQGSVGDEHLQSYLEEYTFRFNRRNSTSRGLVFYRLLQNAICTDPVTEKDITHGYHW